MIKLIAFDLIGVLVTEKDINLSSEEDLLERLFGANISDSDYLNQGRKIISEDSTLVEMTTKIIEKLYKVKDYNIFLKLKNNYPDLKLIIATNHVSYVRDFINKNLNIDYLNDIIISAEINKIKPNLDFYQEIVTRTKIDAKDILFVDDNQNNVDGALKAGMQALKIDHKDDVYEKIVNYLKTMNFD